MSIVHFSKTVPLWGVEGLELPVVRQRAMMFDTFRSILAIAKDEVRTDGYIFFMNMARVCKKKRANKHNLSPKWLLFLQS